MTPPPDTRPVLSNEIPPGEEAVMAFYDLEGAGLSIRRNRFEQAELIDTIISHVRSSDEKVSQKGITQFLAFTKDVATLHGKIGKAKIESVKSDGEGNRTTTSISQTGITNRLAANPPTVSIPAGKERIPAQIVRSRRPASPSGPADSADLAP